MIDRGGNSKSSHRLRSAGARCVMAARRPSSAARNRENGSAKAFTAGSSVEYYSKSYDEWIPAVVGTVRPDGNLRLLHDDGSVLKEQADPSLCRMRATSAGSNKTPSSTPPTRPGAAKAAPKRSPSVRERAPEERRSVGPTGPSPRPGGGVPKAPGGPPRPEAGAGAARGDLPRVAGDGIDSARGERRNSSARGQAKSSPGQPSGNRHGREASEKAAEGPDLNSTINSKKFYVGDRAKIKESGRQGEIMYVGVPSYTRAEIIGMRLDEKRSKSECDGKAPNGERLFRCPAGFGILLPSEEVEKVEREDTTGFNCLSAPEAAVDIEKALNDLIGLAGAKQQIGKIRQLVEVQKKREGLGVMGGKPLHFGFRGGHGTGMSTVARHLAHLLRDMEVVTTGQLLEVSRKELLSGGSDVEKQMEKLWKAAAGGVLMLNDVHLFQDRERSRDHEGLEATEYVAKQLDLMFRRSTGEAASPCWPQAVCVIVAAPAESLLPEPLQRIGFLGVDFPDYSIEDLAEILVQLVRKRKFSLEEGCTVEKLQMRIRESSGRMEASGEKNLVLVRRLLDEAIARQTERVYMSETVSLPGLTTLSEADFIDSFTPTREESMRAALAKLDAVIGLRGVKTFIHSLYAQLKTEMERREAGISGGGGAGTLHMIFSGNPGTGKTTVARIVAELLTSMGLLRKGHLVEADRATLVAGYSGQTALKTRQVVEQALGGLLFIDEAYALVSEDGKDSFGHEALDTLIKMIEDKRQDLVVILAGYPEEMGRLVSSNPGVRSRFPVQVLFEDYTEEELLQIAEKMLLDDVLMLSHGATQALQTYLHKMCMTHDCGRENGNGRMVRNILERAKRRMAVRLQGDSRQELVKKRSHSELCTLEASDFEDVAPPGA